MRFAAVGDALILRRIPETYPGFEAVRDWISQADAKFFNLETTLHREGECFAFAANGGSYLRSEPEVLEDCKRYGFNMTSFCNNHAMDFAYDGLIKTLEHLNASGLVHTGAGKNLDQAAAPVYLDAVGGRIALIAMTQSCNNDFHNIGIAGQQARRVPGRPGVNQMRYKETLIVTPEQMKVIKQIAEQTRINAAEDISRKEGYRDPLPEGECPITKYVNFKEGPETKLQAKCDPRDLARLEKAIYEAKLQADYILFSIHSHQVTGMTKEDPASYLEECAKFAIDHGCDAVIGHGPHLLRPVEIYKGKPIFYSLGDFILNNENIPYSPEEYYTAKNMTSDDTMHELFRKRSNNFTRGLQTDRKMFESVIPLWEMDDSGKLTKLQLLAIELGFGLPRSRNGMPAPAKDSAILERLAEMSAPYGVKMEINGNIATVLLEESK